MNAKTKLYGLLEDDLVDAKATALALVQWISEEDAERFAQVYEIDLDSSDENQ